MFSINTGLVYSESVCLFCIAELFTDKRKFVIVLISRGVHHGCPLPPFFFSMFYFLNPLRDTLDLAIIFGSFESLVVMAKYNFIMPMMSRAMLPTVIQYLNAFDSIMAAPVVRFEVREFRLSTTSHQYSLE